MRPSSLQASPLSDSLNVDSSLPHLVIHRTLHPFSLLPFSSLTLWYTLYYLCQSGGLGFIFLKVYNEIDWLLVYSNWGARLMCRWDSFFCEIIFVVGWFIWGQYDLSSCSASAVTWCILKFDDPFFQEFCCGEGLKVLNVGIAFCVERQHETKWLDG